MVSGRVLERAQLIKWRYLDQVRTSQKSLLGRKDQYHLLHVHQIIQWLNLRRFLNLVLDSMSRQSLTCLWEQLLTFVLELAKDWMWLVRRIRWCQVHKNTILAIDIRSQIWQALALVQVREIQSRGSVEVQGLKPIQCQLQLVMVRKR